MFALVKIHDHQNHLYVIYVNIAASSHLRLKVNELTIMYACFSLRMKCTYILHDGDGKCLSKVHSRSKEKSEHCFEPRIPIRKVNKATAKKLDPTNL